MITYNQDELKKNFLFLKRINLNIKIQLRLKRFKRKYDRESDYWQSRMKSTSKYYDKLWPRALCAINKSYLIAKNLNEVR